MSLKDIKDLNLSISDEFPKLRESQLGDSRVRKILPHLKKGEVLIIPNPTPNAKRYYRSLARHFKEEGNMYIYTRSIDEGFAFFVVMNKILSPPTKRMPRHQYKIRKFVDIPPVKKKGEKNRILKELLKIPPGKALKIDTSSKEEIGRLRNSLQQYRRRLDLRYLSIRIADDAVYIVNTLEEEGEQEDVRN